MTMPSINRVILCGNLCAAPDTRPLRDNRKVSDLRIAVNQKYRGNDGQEKEEVYFANVVVFGRLAEVCDQYLHKGDPLLIEGRLRLEEWTDKETGKKRLRTRIVATNVQFLSSRRRQDEEDEMEARENNGTEAPDNNEEESENS